MSGLIGCADRRIHCGRPGDPLTALSSSNAPSQCALRRPPCQEATTGGPRHDPTSPRTLLEECTSASMPPDSQPFMHRRDQLKPH